RDRSYDAVDPIVGPEAKGVQIARACKTPLRFLEISRLPGKLSDAVVQFGVTIVDLGGLLVALEGLSILASIFERFSLADFLIPSSKVWLTEPLVMKGRKRGAVLKIDADRT